MKNKQSFKKILREILKVYFDFDDYPDIEKNISTSIRNMEYGGVELLIDFLTYMNNNYGQGEFDTISKIRDALTARQLQLKK